MAHTPPPALKPQWGPASGSAQAGGEGVAMVPMLRFTPAQSGFLRSWASEGLMWGPVGAPGLWPTIVTINKALVIGHCAKKETAHCEIEFRVFLSVSRRVTLDDPFTQLSVFQNSSTGSVPDLMAQSPFTTAPGLSPPLNGRSMGHTPPPKHATFTPSW